MYFVIAVVIRKYPQNKCSYHINYTKKINLKCVRGESLHPNKDQCSATIHTMEPQHSSSISASMQMEGIRHIGDGLLEVGEERLKEFLVEGSINDLYDVEQTPFARYVLVFLLSARANLWPLRTCAIRLLP